MTTVLDNGLQDRIAYPPTHSNRPRAEIRYAYPTSGGTTFTSNGNRNMKFWLPRDEDLVVAGEKLLLQFDASFAWGAFTAVITNSTNPGLWLPANIASIFDRFRVRVDTVYVHDIVSGFGLLKRKLLDLLAKYDWIQSSGVIKEGYVCDPDTNSGFAGTLKLRNLNGVTVSSGSNPNLFSLSKRLFAMLDLTIL